MSDTITLELTRTEAATIEEIAFTLEGYLPPRGLELFQSDPLVRSLREKVADAGIAQGDLDQALAEELESRA